MRFWGEMQFWGADRQRGGRLRLPLGHPEFYLLEKVGVISGRVFSCGMSTFFPFKTGSHVAQVSLKLNI